MASGKDRMGDFDVLFDSDGFVALFVEQDAHHQRASHLLEQLALDRQKLAVSNYIVAESATVISRLAGQPAARRFLSFVNSGSLPIVRVDGDLERQILELFSAQDTKRTSVFDCSNVVVMQTLNIPFIFSFDHFYRHFDLKTVANAYLPLAKE